MDSARIALEFANLFCAGMLAGSEFVIHFGLRAPTERLDARSHLQLRQALVLRLRILIPTLFVPTALSALAVAALDNAAPGLWLRCAGLGAIAVWVAIRVVGTVPINSATLDWSLDAPPPDWRERIRRAERFHILGTLAAILAFACFLIAMAVRLTSA